MKLSPLGEFLEKQRSKTGHWTLFMIAVLVVLVGLNFIWTPEHPHFGLDKYTGFWAAFGLLIGLGMVIIMKKIVQPMIARDEEFYDAGD